MSTTNINPFPVCSSERFTIRYLAVNIPPRVVSNSSTGEFMSGLDNISDKLDFTHVSIVYNRGKRIKPIIAPVSQWFFHLSKVIILLIEK